jgi:hypothetical protein
VPLALICHISTQSNTIGSRSAGQLGGSSLRYGRIVYYYHTYVNAKNLEKNILRNIDVHLEKGKIKQRASCRLSHMVRCSSVCSDRGVCFFTCSLQLIHSSNERICL